MFSDFPNLHPLVVHLPIVLLLLSAALQALLVYKDWPPVKWITIGIMAGGFLGAVAASTVFHALPLGLNPRATAVFEAHEKFAGYTMWLSGITLLLAGIGVGFKIQRRAYEVLVLVAAVATAGVLSVAGHRGAQLVYVEGVGPQGNLLDKSHGHGGEEEMPGMDMPAPGADGHSKEPQAADSTRPSAAATSGTTQPGMEGMNMATQPRGSQPQRAPGGRAAQPGAMADMPGMDMPGMTRQRPAASGSSRTPQPAAMDMSTMPGMDMGATRSKSASPKKTAMSDMKGMENMPGMQPSGGPKPATTRQPANDLSSMPGMKQGDAMPGMGDRKGMEKPGVGTMPGMPGMTMPNPLDKYRFEDNNPARSNPKSDK